MTETTAGQTTENQIITALVAANKSNGVAWENLCTLFIDNGGFGLLDAKKGKDCMKTFGVHMSNSVKVPDVIEDTKGNFIDSRDPDTKVVKWRSWKVTKVMWQYATYITKVGERDGWKSLEKLMKDGITSSKMKALAYQKPDNSSNDDSGDSSTGKESPLDTIRRSAQLIISKFPELDKGDKGQINGILADIMTEWAKAQS